MRILRPSCTAHCPALPCTDPSCQAYCSYTAERLLLFSQGVTLHVQPDGRTWRKLGMLSGGQRSLATLALSFALQVCLVGSALFLPRRIPKVTNTHVQTVVLACRLQLNLCCTCSTRSCFACLAAAATNAAADAVSVSLLLFRRGGLRPGHQRSSKGGSVRAPAVQRPLCSAVPPCQPQAGGV